MNISQGESGASTGVVARLYQHSPRADDEFSSFAPVAKYCIGLARYMQSPLNEYAALGPDIVAINFDEGDKQVSQWWLIAISSR